MQYFVQDVRDRDVHGKLKRAIIFPRYHQLESVRNLVAHARNTGPGQNYLVQHSAGFRQVELDRLVGPSTGVAPRRGRQTGV